MTTATAADPVRDDAEAVVTDYESDTSSASSVPSKWPHTSLTDQGIMSETITVPPTTSSTTRVVFEAEASRRGSKAGGLPHPSLCPFPPLPFPFPLCFQTNQWEGTSDPVRGKFPGLPPTKTTLSTTEYIPSVSNSLHPLAEHDLIMHFVDHPEDDGYGFLSRLSSDLSSESVSHILSKLLHIKGILSFYATSLIMRRAQAFYRPHLAPDPDLSTPTGKNYIYIRTLAAMVVSYRLYLYIQNSISISSSSARTFVSTG